MVYLGQQGPTGPAENSSLSIDVLALLYQMSNAIGQGPACPQAWAFVETLSGVLLNQKPVNSDAKRLHAFVPEDILDLLDQINIRMINVSNPDPTSDVNHTFFANFGLAIVYYVDPAQEPYSVNYSFTKHTTKMPPPTRLPSFPVERFVQRIYWLLDEGSKSWGTEVKSFMSILGWYLSGTESPTGPPVKWQAYRFPN